MGDVKWANYPESPAFKKLIDAGIGRFFFIGCSSACPDICDNLLESAQIEGYVCQYEYEELIIILYSFKSSI